MQYITLKRHSLATSLSFEKKKKKKNIYCVGNPRDQNDEEHGVCYYF